MQVITTIGLDIAKSVFQVHGIDAKGQVVIRRQLKRRYVLAFFQKLSPCLVGIEACASSHHWSREIKAVGHNVRLMPPAYVKPYVKRQKNDMADAEAICEAVTRANMRFVPTKTPEQQSCLMLHRTRHMFIRQQTAVINPIPAPLGEFGIVAPVGRNGVEKLLNVVADPNDSRRHRGDGSVRRPDNLVSFALRLADHRAWPAADTLVWRHIASDRRMDGKSAHGSMRLGTGSPLSDPRSGRGLWLALRSKTSINGHSRSTDVATFPLAKRIC